MDQAVLSEEDGVGIYSPINSESLQMMHIVDTMVEFFIDKGDEGGH